MSVHYRDLAKFMAGVAANETLGHWWLGIWGSELLPMKIGSFTFTRTFNMFSMIFWPTMLALLVYWAWFHHRTTTSANPPQILRPT